MDARRWLEQLEEAESDPSAGVAYLAARKLNIDEAAMRAARRRALLILAAGGDPHRELELDSRAVASVAADLDAPSLRRALDDVLDGLGSDAHGLRRVEAALGALREDGELAWRWVACALLAEELADAEG
jgi:hypothetical protein